MIYPLSILLLTTAACYLLDIFTGKHDATRWVALAGTGVALVVALVWEGLQGGGANGMPVSWPDFMGWLGAPFYRSDILAASLGAWCILLGGLCLLKCRSDEAAPTRQASIVLLITLLYSLVYTNDLRAFAAQVLLLVLLTWGILWDTSHGPTLVPRQRVAQAAGALALLGAVLLMGRITGGVYGLDAISLSALTFWPLLLLVLFAIFWLGLVPVTGWSGLIDGGAKGAEGTLVQGLVLGVPVLVIILRLQALITGQALAGSVPDDWTWFMSALGWVGAITALTGGAAVIVWAGTTRWSAALTAGVMGSAVWALSLDTPTGRYAAIAMILSFGLARLTLDLSSGQYEWLSRLAAGFSIVCAPLTAGFIGAWLLAGGLVEARHASLVIVLAGAFILAACGTALHLAIIVPHAPVPNVSDRYSGPLALCVSVLLVLAGTVPGAWLPQVEAIAAIAGGSNRIGTGWTGLVSGGLFAPLPLLAAAALLVGGLGWLLRAWMKSTATSNSVLLPTAIARLQKLKQGTATPVPLLSNPPPAVWWLSLVWLERGLYGAGVLLGRLSTRFGILLARLEGRYYFPLALILTLLILLAVTR